MTIAEMLSELPDKTRVAVVVGSGELTVGEIREAFAGGNPDRVLTTTEAAVELGYSPDSWQKWAARGRIEKAWQDADGGPWRLPYASCQAHRDGLQRRALKKGKRRGPWKGKAPPPASTRAEGVSRQGLQVVPSGSQAMGRTADPDPESGGPRLAGPRRAHRARGDR